LQSITHDSTGVLISP